MKPKPQPNIVKANKKDSNSVTPNGDNAKFLKYFFRDVTENKDKLTSLL